MGEQVIHILIVADDRVAQEIYKTYVLLFSKELNRNVEVITSSYQEHELENILLGNFLYDIAILESSDNQKETKLIDLAKSLLKMKQELPIIYISDVQSFRVKASELLGIGFLLKPVDQKQLRILFYRAVGQTVLQNKIEDERYLELSINRKKVFIKLHAIVCLEKIQKKILFTTKNNVYEERNTIAAITTRLPPYFLQINQSVIVNMNEIICIEGRQVYLTTNQDYIIGRTFQRRVELSYRRFAR